MVIKEKTLKYLNKNSTLNIDMIEAINRNTALIKYADIDGVILIENNSQAVMISVDRVDILEKALDGVSDVRIAVCHQSFLSEFVAAKLNMVKSFVCYQAAYFKNVCLPLVGMIEIRPLKETDITFVLKYYKVLDEEDLIEIVGRNDLYGGYIKKDIVGFVGRHQEGSLGLLHVLEEYRGNGYAKELISFMVNKELNNGNIPFCQIKMGNEASMKLLRKLGFMISSETICWMFSD